MSIFDRSSTRVQSDSWDQAMDGCCHRQKKASPRVRASTRKSWRRGSKQNPAHWWQNHHTKNTVVRSVSSSSSEPTNQPYAPSLLHTQCTWIKGIGISVTHSCCPIVVGEKLCSCAMLMSTPWPRAAFSRTCCAMTLFRTNSCPVEPIVHWSQS